MLKPKAQVHVGSLAITAIQGGRCNEQHGAVQPANAFIQRAMLQLTCVGSR
jgi:hypothetical protein